MLNLGIIGFAQPWLLLALAALPVIWLLLRVTPPTPKTLAFPAISLLRDLAAQEETPARTPLWLLLLRLLIVALIILALAQPLINPSKGLGGAGPVIVIIDDGWAAGRGWPKTQASIDRWLSQAERENRQVILMTTAQSAESDPLRLEPALPAAEIKARVQSLKPKPWSVDRQSVLEALKSSDLKNTGSPVIWFSDGLAHGAEEGDIEAFAEGLIAYGPLTLVRPGLGNQAQILLPPQVEALGLVLQMERAEAGPSLERVITSHGAGGEVLARSNITFEAGETLARSVLELPVEIRNRITQLQIENEPTAGAVLLLDERWRRRPVGLVTLEGIELTQPLLRENYYLERALEPFTELRQGSLADLLRREIAILVLPDGNGRLDEDSIELLEPWLQRGGILLRFAGPQLAEDNDGFLPVNLRQGDRVLGGALTWATPSGLAPFPVEGPFRALELPQEVVVTRQVLAEPSLDLPSKTWARLADGTPLVTAEKRGEGWLVLVHTTANTDWSNLAISGLFVSMLKRMIDLSQGLGAAVEAEPLKPLANLDGFGVLGSPSEAARPLAFNLEGAANQPGPLHPPGFYGKDQQRRAHNLGGKLPTLAPLGTLPSGATVADENSQAEGDLKPLLLLLASLLFLLDFLVSILLRGHARRGGGGRWRGRRRRRQEGALAGLLALFFLALPSPLEAQSSGDDARALEATLATRLAFVETDLPQVDRTSAAGLSGLTRMLHLRTSVEAMPPLAVNVETDELAFYPLLYWPVVPEAPSLSDHARQKVQDYMRSGGTILFDLRDPRAGAQFFGQSNRASDALQELLRGIDVPPLEPVPEEHVLTKAFYLMDDFPGRYVGGALWLETAESSRNDGVSSILIGSNDWAGAWAVDQLGQPLHTLVPGGTRQRELAYRFGINLVMYTLTGNYKADQVHVPFILERLGQ